jgi:hypothetical protein
MFPECAFIWPFQDTFKEMAQAEEGADAAKSSIMLPKINGQGDACLSGGIVQRYGPGIHVSLLLLTGDDMA